MTGSTIALAELVEKGADIDELRQMVQLMAQRLMEIDVERRCDAAYDAKSAERPNSRNGFREHSPHCHGLAMVGSFAQATGDRISDPDLAAFVTEGRAAEFMAQAQEFLGSSEVLSVYGQDVATKNKTNTATR